MSCEKCGCGQRGMRFCPVAFGIALGLTVGLAVVCWFGWLMYVGVTPMPGWKDTLEHAFWAAFKGFVFGFVVALIYNLIGKCCKCPTCRQPKSTHCGCACCATPIPPTTTHVPPPEATKQL